MERQRQEIIQSEYGKLFKHGGKVKSVLVFPASYYLGMSSLGFQVICHELNQNPNVSCERAFILESDPFPKSFETNKKLSDFDIIAFSLSFELDYFNVVESIYNSGIPLKTGDRTTKDPLIIAGGICPSFNPEPLSDFIDAFIIGDGEEAIHEFISVYLDYQHLGRQELLLKLSDIDGVYVPSLYNFSYDEYGILKDFYPKNKIRRRNIDLNAHKTVSKILTPYTEFSNTYLIEISRGCIHKCKFCVGSHIQKIRFRPADAIIELTKSDLAEKADKIGLVGSSVTDHPKIDEIVMAIVNMGKKVTLASMRADSVSDVVLDALAKSDQGIITLAPEAGSERLRKSVGKDISIDDIFRVIQSALKRGINGAKLYFMIGLPDESQDDIDDIIKVVVEIKKLMKSYIKPNTYPRLIISVSPFVPKPQTPFQLCPMEEEKNLIQKLQYLKRGFGKIGGIRLTSASIKWSAIQGVFARGDRRLGNVLHDMKIKGLSWNKALKINSIDQQFFLQRKRKSSELLPWEHIGC